MRARAVIIAVLLVGLAAAPARAAESPPAALLDDVAVHYRQAVVSHDAALAAELRTETRLLQAAYPSSGLDELVRAVDRTRNQFRPWPLAGDVIRLVARARGGASPAAGASERPYDAVDQALDRTADLTRSGSRGAAAAEGLRAYALSASVRDRLGAGSGALDAAFWSTDARRPGVLSALDRQTAPPVVDDAVDRASDQLGVAQQQLGEVRVSKATVVGDAAILVFREGLEAVLILAAITASFVGTRRHLRRPVLLGGLAGIGATGLTWVLVNLLVSELGTGGLRLEAITGILAIVVLLVVTNWFFHRIYWSQWIARFNRRRRQLERLDRLGFLSGQTLALVVLGMTSVYREGFETVLFLQNLQVSAGTGACLLGSGIGLAATLALGCVTFLAQRKLPYKQMLIATGVLIAVVLAVMTGTTVHVMQGLGWLPSSPAPFTAPLWVNSWLGLYATWQGLAAQAGALAVVLGSYFVAREVQVRGPQRRQRRQRAGVGAQADVTT